MNKRTGDSMNYWILQTNPNVFVLEHECLYKEGQEDWWGISRYYNEIEFGDIAYIWKARDYRRFNDIKPRGIYAKATILLEPRRISQFQGKLDYLKQREAKYWSNLEQKTNHESKRAVIIKYCEPTNKLGLNALTENKLFSAGLGNIGPFKFTNAEIYKLDEEHAYKIEGLIKN
jgi:hypothetical protein